MSVFSDLLEQYIKEKEIKIYSMAAACQIDRSMLYRIISGKRNPPSPEIFSAFPNISSLHLQNTSSSLMLTSSPGWVLPFITREKAWKIFSSVFQAIWLWAISSRFFVRRPFHQIFQVPRLPAFLFFLRQSSTTISMGFSFWKQQRKRALSSFLYSQTVPFCLVCSQACVCTAP